MKLFCTHENKKCLYFNKYRPSFETLWYCPACKKYASYDKSDESWSAWVKDPFKNGGWGWWTSIENGVIKGDKYTCDDCIYKKLCGEWSKTTPCRSKKTKKDVTSHLGGSHDGKRKKILWKLHKQ